jgi:hypothetical protein
LSPPEQKIRVAAFGDLFTHGDEVGEDCADRFRALAMERQLGTEMYGVIRSDVLRQTRLLDFYYSSDRALLVELVLLGRFARFPMFFFRAKSTRNVHRGRSPRMRRVKLSTRAPHRQFCRPRRSTVSIGEQSPSTSVTLIVGGVADEQRFAGGLRTGTWPD